MATMGWDDATTATVPRSGRTANARGKTQAASAGTSHDARGLAGSVHHVAATPASHTATATTQVPRRVRGNILIVAPPVAICGSAAGPATSAAGRAPRRYRRTTPATS